MDPVTRLTEFASKGELALFCGSGISVLPPSDLPTWQELVRKMLQALAHTDPDLEHACACLDIAAVPLLYFSQVVYDNIGSYYFEALRCFECAKPNPNHAYVSALSEAGYVNAIITTNFDSLIEDTIASQPRPMRTIVTPKDFDGFSLDSASDAITVIKLHGSTHNPGTIVDTFDQKSGGLPSYVIQTWRYVLQNRLLFFIGYSGADLGYDRNYLLFQDTLDTAKGIVWNLRPGESNPSIERLCEEHPSKVVVNRQSLPEALRGLARKLGVTDLDVPQLGDAHSKTQPWWEEALKEWASSIDVKSSATILYDVANKMGAYHVAWICSEVLLRCANQAMSTSAWTCAKLKRARLAWSQNEYDVYHREMDGILNRKDGVIPAQLAREVYEDLEDTFGRTVDLLREKKSPERLLMSLDALTDDEILLVQSVIQCVLPSLTAGKMKALSESRKYQRLVEHLAEMLETSEIKASVLIGLGTAYYETFSYDAAYRVHSQACAILENAGRASRLGDAYIELGLACHSVGKRSDGNGYLNKAIDILEKIAHFHSLGIACYDFAYCNRDELTEVVRARIARSIAIFRRLRLQKYYVYAMRLKYEADGVPEWIAHKLQFELDREIPVGIGRL